MGYWVNTTYINHGDVNDVAEAIRVLFEAEGMRCIPSPAQRTRLLVEPMQYDGALHNDLWGLAILPGARSWTVIQTAPLELLSERANGVTRMRLADLCIALSASAFQLHVYDSSAIILVEVAADGDLHLSGINTQGSDPLTWHNERLHEEFVEAQFRLHPFQDVIAGCTSGDDTARAIADRFAGENASFCSNLVSVDTLICRKPFTVPGANVLYFAWPGKSRQRYSPCASWEEYRATTRQP